MYRISRFDNVVPFNIKNTTQGKVIEYEQFRDFAETFRNCTKGSKFDEYFVRGQLDPFKRLDVHLKQSNVFVIDGDQSSDGGNAPSSVAVQKYFRSLGTEYCFYTTFSRTFERNKFRIVIPLSRGIVKDELKPLAKNFMTFINSAGCDIGYVKEMSVWSQPWFYPTRENPDDGLFEWHYEEGKPLDVDTYLSLINFPDKEKGIFGKGIVKQIQENAASEAKSIDEHLEDIKTGHYHQAIIALSFGKAKDGIAFKQNLAEMRFFMKQVPSELQDERYTERFSDLERTVKGAYDRLETEQAESIDDYGIKFKQVTDQNLPWPPGLLGELADVALGQANYPHKEVAFVSALGLVAGIAGRKFNVNSRRGLGLNVYFMLAANSGVGKNSIKDFLTDNIPAPDGGVKSSFIGPSDFTAATGLIKNHLANARCMTSVMGELGYVMESDAGNKAGKRRAILELYTASGHRDVLHGTAFSDSDKSVPDIDSPCFSIVGESTPDVLIANIMKDNSVRDGLFPRFSVFRINEINIIPNRSYMEMPDALRLRIKELVETCEKVQAQANPEAHLLTLFNPDLMFAHEEFWRKEMRDLSEHDQIKSATASRLHAKALKYAGLATVFNKGKNEKDCLVIEKPEWEWAQDMVKYEMKTVANFFQGGASGSPLDDAATRIFGKYILLAMDVDAKHTQKKLYASMDPAMRKDRAITVSVLRQITASQFRLSANPGKDTFDVVLNHMITQGYVKRDRAYNNKFSVRTRDVIVVKQAFYDRLVVMDDN